MSNPTATFRRQAANSWRKRWHAVACAWIVCIAGWTGISLVPGIDQTTTRAVGFPYLPSHSVLPPGVLLVCATLAAGLAAGVLVAVVLSRRDPSFMAVEDLRPLGLPVIGSVSLVPGQERRRHGIARVLALVGSVLLLGAVCGGLVYRLAGAGGAT